MLHYTDRFTITLLRSRVMLIHPFIVFVNLQFYEFTIFAPFSLM